MTAQSNRIAHNALHTGAALAVIGVVVTVVASRFHGGTDPADLQAVLPQYAPQGGAVAIRQILGSKT